MPGDDWQKFASLRLLLAYLVASSGKKLLFMGGEFGQWKEWSHDASLEWDLLQHPSHQGLQRWVRDLNTFYRARPALHEWDANADGFQWIDASDSERSIVSFRRQGSDSGRPLIFVFNFTPMPRQNYRIGVPVRGEWKEVLNGDAALYGGSGQGNLGSVETSPVPMHGHPWSLNLTLPPLAMIAFERADS
jgi:1,4-alpha-glucan branching enzyme